MKTELFRFFPPLAVGMVLGAAIATAVWMRRSPGETAPPPPATPAHRAGDAELLQSLLAERDAANAQLRAEVARLRGQPAVVVTNPAVAPPAVSAPRTNSVPWLERVRQEDPARYKQIQEAREQRRQAVADWFNTQFDRLDQRLQAAQTQEEGDLVTQIAETLQEIEELGQRWQQVRALPEEERREASAELGGAMREAYRTLRDLRDQDRQLQFQQLAQSLGYRDPQAAGQLVETLNGIIKETEVNPFRGMGWGGGRGSGGGGQPAP